MSRSATVGMSALNRDRPSAIGDLVGDNLRIFTDAAKKGRFAFAHEMESDEEQARYRGACALGLDRKSGVVKRIGPGKPGTVVRAKATRENDRAEISEMYGFHALRFERIRIGKVRKIQTVLERICPEMVAQLFVTGVAPRDAILQVGREPNITAFDP